MNQSFLKTSLLLAASFALVSFRLPLAWYDAGSHARSYEMGIDKSAGKDASNAATIKSIDKKIEGFGTLMQQCATGKFLGKRIKMTAFVKSENVEGWSGLWIRVDQSGSEKPLSFDNMDNRPIKGTSAWTEYEIVFDVPNNASLIAFGALLHGTGQIWFDDISFEIVGDNVALKDPKVFAKNDRKCPIEKEPANLSFEQ